MTSRILSKLFPLQITRRFYFWTIILTLIPTLIMIAVIPPTITKMVKSEKEKLLYGVVDRLRSRLPRSYNGILKEKGALQYSPEGKIKVLHSVLQPIVNDISHSFPGIETGYYSTELNSILAINHEIKPFNRLNIPMDSNYLKSNKNQKPEFGQRNTSLGWNGKPVIWYAHPVRFKGEVVGYVWASVKNEIIYAEAARVSAVILLLWLGLAITLLLIALRVSNKIKDELLDFTNALIENSALNSEVLPELNPLKDKIMDYRKKESFLQQRFSAVFNASPCAIALLALPDYKYVDVNESFVNTMGFSRDEVLGSTPDECNIWFDSSQRDLILNAMCESSFGRNLEVKVKTRTERVLTVIASLRNMQLDDREYILIVFSDITEQKQVELDLKQSNELFRKAFNFSPFPMAIMSFEEGRFIEVNEAFLDISGYSRDEVLGVTVLDINLYCNSEHRSKFVQDLQLNGYFKNFETEFQIKSGEKRVVLLSTKIINFDGKLCSLVIANDVTELKKAEQDRMKLQKEMARLDCLHIVGEMATGIGHEIRNPMTSVKGFLQLLANKETDDKKKEYYDLMIDELDRANSIISEFLSLAKDRIVELHPASLNVIINALYPLLNSDAMKQDKRIILNKGDVPNILLNEKEIRQLIINLVRNAIEASPSMRCIIVSTYVSDDEVVLAVKDEGTGIPPEIYDKLGTPFVTTKDSGTGLGVSICYSIAHKHNAKIDVDTGSNGTTFYVRFRIPEHLIEKAS